jgi:biopolymer transport protein ExbD
MKLKRQSRFHHEVGASAMNDIMFFLLLFFLIVSTMANPQVMQLMLPRANSDETVIKKQVNLSVTADKRYYIDKREVAFESLEAEIAEAIKSMSDPTIVLRVDRALDIQSMVDVLELGMKLRVKIVLQTSTKE